MNEQTEQLNRQMALLMLDVILASDKTAAIKKAAFWDQQIQIDDMDYGVMKLIPFFLHQLKKLSYESLHQNRLKVLYKYWWLKTLKNLDQLQEVIALLRSQQIPMLLIKGVPLLPYYPARELRPMADLDILIPREDVMGAIEQLRAAGWIPKDGSFYQRLKSNSDLCLDFNHSIELEHVEGKTKMDLHWKVGNYASWDLTQTIWANGIPSAQFEKVFQPSLADSLAMTLLHASDSESKHHYNWILDVKMMEKDLSPEVWQAACELAQAEKKEDWFDFACHTLLQRGIEAPIPSRIITPPAGRLTKKQFGNKKNLPRYLWKKIENNLIILEINFPHVRGFQKLKLFVRRITYFLMNRTLRT